MKVISVLNQKGGSGKTTIATHLAREIQRRGHEVLLVDSDPQGSARDWASVNEEHPVTVVGIDRPTIDRDLKKIAKGFDFVIIDGAPQIAEISISSIKVSDLVVIPVQPSPYDIWATSDLVDVIKQRIEITDGALKAGFLVSRAIHGTKIGDEVSQALAEYELPIFKSKIHQRVVFPNSAAVGSTVMDIEPNGLAASEIAAFVDEIINILIN